MAQNKTLNKKDKKKYTMKGSCLWGILLLLILVFIDQATKLVADAYFSSANAPESIAIIPNWIELRIRYNPDFSYGIGGGASPMVKLLVIAGTGVIMLGVTILYFALDKRRAFLRVALVFVVAGGLGNLIDRVYYQVWDPAAPFGVRDMVDLSRFGFAVCNFADFFISAGAVMLVLSLLFFDKDALIPVGKYKVLAKEAKAEREAVIEKIVEEKSKKASGEPQPEAENANKNVDETANQNNG